MKAIPRKVSSFGLFNLANQNIAWNMFGGAWTGLLIIIATPWYVSTVGLDGYGLLGLWLMMQALMSLLDMGIGASLVREFANSSQDESSFNHKRDVLRTLECVYWLMALLLTLILIVSAEQIGANWISSAAFSSTYLRDVIMSMAIALGLQFPCALYSNGLAGLQKQRVMNLLQATANSFRHGCGVAVLLWTNDLVSFFMVQACIAAVQAFTTRLVVQSAVSILSAPRPKFRMEILRDLWRFSAGMAATAAAAVLLANADRIALSAMVLTEDLGKYAVAFTAAGLIQIGIQPFYRAYYPRYSELVSLDNPKQLKDEYFRSCMMMATVIIPVGIIGWIFAPEVFYAWLGKPEMASVEVFRWLLIGIGFSGLMWLPAALQHAHGWTSLHVKMIFGALLLGTPIMVWAIKAYGIVGGTGVWVMHGFLEITLGAWLMHRRLLVGHLFDWYRRVPLPPLLISGPLALLSCWLMPDGLSRVTILFWIGITGLIVCSTCFYFNWEGLRAQIDD